ncbi:MAG: LysR family transcriptional regulator [Proteobacteria bacterium]|nr:LysR family transcriptional regulator [Pseudomonadota bacterium]
MHFCMTVAAEPSWDLYRAFLAVLREGSLSAAARTLGLTQPTVGRQIEALQRQLGVALFTRSPQGLSPTPAALALRDPAQAMASAAEALRRAATGEADEPAGVVRLSASEIVGVEVLPAILADFRAQHPGVIVELSVSNAVEDLLRRDVDVAVRMTRPRQQALVARRIGAVRIGLYAHRRYAERFGLPASLDDLRAHPVIGMDRRPLPVPPGSGLSFPVTRDLFAFRCDSDPAQLSALRAGFGVGGCQVPLARRDADLLPVLPDQVRFELEVWVVMHEDLRTSRRTRLMFDALAAGLGDYLADPAD